MESQDIYIYINSDSSYRKRVNCQGSVRENVPEGDARVVRVKYELLRSELDPSKKLNLLIATVLRRGIDRYSMSIIPKWLVFYCQGPQSRRLV